MGWSRALAVLAVFVAAMLPLAIPLFDHSRDPARTDAGHMTAMAALRIALRHRDFQLLALGFFVCGFQVVFVATHVPAFLADKGLSLQTGSVLLALIGLLNIPGTYYAGLWGGRYSKAKLLALIYSSRGIVIAAFVLLPASELNAYAFGAAMGLFWLSTVPLTNGTVATLFGVRNMAMLSGIVFLAHQIGGFLGSWSGGLLFDRLQSYDAGWLLLTALSLLAVLVNLQIKEAQSPLPKPEPRTHDFENAAWPLRAFAVLIICVASDICLVGGAARCSDDIKRIFQRDDGGECAEVDAGRSAAHGRGN